MRKSSPRQSINRPVSGVARASELAGRALPAIGTFVCGLHAIRRFQWVALPNRTRQPFTNFIAQSG